MKTILDIANETTATAVVKQLVVGPVPRDFSPATHVALGPWCFFGNEKIYPAWDTLAFVNPFASNGARNAGGRASSALTQVLTEELYPEMNRRYGTNYGRDFWRCVLGDWLVYLVMLTWRIWRHVEAFVELHGHETYRVPLNTITTRFQFADTQDFVTCCTYHSAFREWLVHEAVRRLAPKHWIIETAETITPPAAQAPAVPHGARWAMDRLDDKVFYCLLYTSDAADE